MQALTTLVLEKFLYRGWHWSRLSCRCYQERLTKQVKLKWSIFGCRKQKAAKNIYEASRLLPYQLQSTLNCIVTGKLVATRNAQQKGTTILPSKACRFRSWQLLFGTPKSVFYSMNGISLIWIQPGLTWCEFGIGVDVQQVVSLVKFSEQEWILGAGKLTLPLSFLPHSSFTKSQ